MNCVVQFRLVKIFHLYIIKEIENSKFSYLYNQTRRKVWLCLTQCFPLKSDQKLLWCGAGSSRGCIWAWEEGYGQSQCYGMLQLRKGVAVKCFTGTDIFVIDRLVVGCGFLLIYDLGKSNWNQTVYQRHDTFCFKEHQIHSLESPLSEGLLSYTVVRASRERSWLSLLKQRKCFSLRNSRKKGTESKENRENIFSP